MKKKLIIPVLLSLCLLFASCSGKKGDVYLISVSDGLSDSSVADKIDKEYSAQLTGSDFNDASAASAYDIVVNGEGVSGTYQKSRHNFNTSVILDYYKSQTGDVVFAVSRGDHKLGYYSKTYPEDESLPALCTVEEGKDIAVTFLEGYTDIENYTMTRSGSFGYEGSGVYSYTFKRYLGDIATGDTIHIRVDSRRNIVCEYKNYSVSEFAGVTLPEGFSLERSMYAVEAKTGEMLTAALTTSDAGAPDFEVLKDTGYIVRTEKGRLALAVDVNIARQGTNFKERVTMLMLIN